jgi:hypothetical protein
LKETDTISEIESDAEDFDFRAEPDDDSDILIMPFSGSEDEEPLDSHEVNSEAADLKDKPTRPSKVGAPIPRPVIPPSPIQPGTGAQTQPQTARDLPWGASHKPAEQPVYPQGYPVRISPLRPVQTKPILLPANPDGTGRKVPREPGLHTRIGYSESAAIQARQDFQFKNGQLAPALKFLPPNTGTSTLTAEMSRAVESSMEARRMHEERMKAGQLEYKKAKKLADMRQALHKQQEQQKASEQAAQRMRTEQPLSSKALPKPSPKIATRPANPAPTSTSSYKPRRLPLPPNPIRANVPVAPTTTEIDCQLCQKRHAPGGCPLREIPLQQCPGCGYSHLHAKRGCPLIQHEEYVELIRQRLKEATGDPATIRAAKTYYNGVGADYNLKRQIKEGKKPPRYGKKESTTITKE